jgi:DNA-binding transcriptional MerR regulator
VDTVRFYQARGLLPAPRRAGRVAFYGEEHQGRLERIRDLQAKGLTLATIRRLLDGELDAADEALVTALVAPSAAAGVGGPGDVLTLEQLAERSGIPQPILDAVVREGLLVPRRGGYDVADVEVAKAGLALLSHGLPMPELLDLARQHNNAMRAVAEQAVALFDAHVRQPLRSSTLDDGEAAARLVESFEALLPATATIVAHHFTRTLLAVATEHIERVGAPAELAAVERATS